MYFFWSRSLVPKLDWSLEVFFLFLKFKKYILYYKQTKPIKQYRSLRVKCRGSFPTSPWPSPRAPSTGCPQVSGRGLLPFAVHLNHHILAHWFLRCFHINGIKRFTFFHLKVKKVSLHQNENNELMTTTNAAFSLILFISSNFPQPWKKCC